jgi:H2-forming N5,N10-methylenetetrahydromethanopterin dehydrogenase-like enzyme
VVSADGTPTHTAVKVVTIVEALRAACKQFTASSPNHLLSQAIDALLAAADEQVGKTVAGVAESCKKSILEQCKTAINAEGVEQDVLSVSTCSSLESLASASHIPAEQKNEYMNVAKTAKTFLDLVSYSVRVSDIPKMIHGKAKEGTIQRCLMDFKKFKELSDIAEAQGKDGISTVLFSEMPAESAKLADCLASVRLCLVSLES